MSSARKRLDKVLELRKDRLEAALLRLARDQNARAGAAKDLELAREREQAARQHRASVASSLALAERWQEAADWAHSRETERVRAELALLRADRAVSAARSGVMSAKNDLRRIEMLVEHRRQRELREAERAERKTTDEFAAHKVLEAQRRAQ